MAKSGRQLARSIASSASGLPSSKWVAAVEARWPPAEKPQIPRRCGSRFHSFARARTVRRARCTACIGAGWVYFGAGGVVLGGVAILEHGGRDAPVVEPLRDVLPLVVGGEAAVTAAGTDHDPRPGRALGNGKDGERRLVGRVGPLRAGRAVGPEQF